MRLTLRALLTLALITSAAIGAPSSARADGVVVWTRLPVERRAEVLSALRLELAGRATLVEGEVVDPERVTVAEMREEARAAGATHAVWIVFPGGLLAPAEVRVLDLARTTAARAMTAQAWDVVDPRVVAVLAASLIDAAGAEASVVAGGEVQPPSEPVVAEAVSEPIVAVAVEAASTSEEPVAEDAARDEQLVLEEPVARPARTFSLIVPGLSLVHSSLPGRELELQPGVVAFYGRVSEWASIGIRFRGGFGYGTIEGAIFSGGLGAPSIAVGFREGLGTAAAIELGVHAEGGLYLRYSENFSDRTRLSFGVGVGAFVTLELGRVIGIQLDYTLDAYDFGGSSPTISGAATLAYVHRWD